MVAVGQLELSCVESVQWDVDLGTKDWSAELLVLSSSETTLLHCFLSAVERAAIRGLAAAEEFDARGDVVDVLGQVLWDVVFVASNMLVAGGEVLVLVVLGLEELLGLVGGEIELDPLLVDRLRDSLGGDASLLQPVVDLVDSMLWWSKELNDFLRRVPLAVLGGVWVGAAKS